MASEGIPIVFGGAGIGPGKAFPDADAAKPLLDALEAGGCKIIDTAQLYGGSEEVLGQVDAPKRFIIDTKHAGLTA